MTDWNLLKAEQELQIDNNTPKKITTEQAENRMTAHERKA